MSLCAVSLCEQGSGVLCRSKCSSNPRSQAPPTAGKAAEADAVFPQQSVHYLLMCETQASLCYAGAVAAAIPGRKLLGWGIFYAPWGGWYGGSSAAAAAAASSGRKLLGWGGWYGSYGGWYGGSSAARHCSSSFFRYACRELHLVLSSLFMHFWRRLVQLDCLLIIKHLIIPKLTLLTGCPVYEVSLYQTQNRNPPPCPVLSFLVPGL